MKRAAKIGAYVCCGLLVLWVALSAVAAQLTTMPKNRSFDDEEKLADVAVEPVTFKTEDGIELSGWYAPGQGKRAVVFTHGIGSDRRQLKENMAFFLKRGFAGLAIDLRGHGKSQPARVTMGWNERRDLEAAVKFLNGKGYDQVGADGISLGAATICYSMLDNPGLSFIILESSYDHIDNALNNRLAMVGAPAFLAASFRMISTWMIGVGPEQLRPVDCLKQCRVPALILAGDNEAEIPLDNTQSLFDSCASSLKELHIFKQATHKHRLIAKYTDEYTGVVDAFLAKVFPAEQGAFPALAAAAPVPAN